MDYANDKNSLDYLEKIEKDISQCNTFYELSKVFEISTNGLIKIFKINDIKLESSISNYQKYLFMSYFRNFYTKYFTVKFSKIELLKRKEYRKSSKKIASKSLEAKQKMLNKLETGFQFNYIGLFNELRVKRIEKLKDEILLLKKAQKTTMEKNSNYKKPYARIIYTPMGGKNN